MTNAYSNYPFTCSNRKKVGPSRNEQYAIKVSCFFRVGIFVELEAVKVLEKMVYVGGKRIAVIKTNRLGKVEALES